MKIEIKFWLVILIIIALLGAFYYAGGIKVRRERDRLAEDVYTLQNQLSDTINTYEIELYGERQTIAEQNSIILTQKQAIDNHILDKERLRAINIDIVKENVRLKASLSVMKDSLDMVEPEIIYVLDSLGINIPHLKLPYGLFYEDEWIGLGVSLFQDATWAFKMNTDINLDVTIGERRKGLFRKEPMAIVGFDNPYINDVRVQSLSVEKSPLFFERTWFRITTHGLAFLGGYWFGGR